MTSSIEQQAQRAADEFRREHRLGVQPLGDLVAMIEQTTGHDVAILDADPDEHGLIMRDPERDKVFIGVARSHKPMRQRGSLAHELAHLIFQDWSDELGERSPEEIRADAFARHLLIPQEGVKEFLGNTHDVSGQHLSDVVQRFLVSPAMASIAMRDASYVSKDVASEWRGLPTPQLAMRFGWSDQYETLKGDSNRLRAPQGLVSRAIAGYAEGVVSAQTIATLRRVTAERVVHELQEIGIVPKVMDEMEFEPDELPDIDVDLSGLEDEDRSP